MKKYRKILEKINCPHLTLERSSGMYHLFVYWNPVANKFNCRKVNVAELKDLPKSAWISIGRDFVNAMESSSRTFSFDEPKKSLTFF